MKILFISQGYQIDDQPSYHNAFVNARSFGCAVEVKNLPFMGWVAKFGWNSLWQEIIRINEEWHPDLVFFQFFHAFDTQSPRKCIERLRNSQNNPLVFGSLGDLYQCKLHLYYRPPPKGLLDLAIDADAFFSTSMGELAEYFVAHGARNFIFLPNAYSDNHFGDGREYKTADKAFDVVMVGSVTDFYSLTGLAKLGLSCFIRPLRVMKGISQSVRRYQVANLMWQHYGKRFGVWGHGWRHPAHQGPIAFREQVSTFHLARVALDSRPPYDQMYYTSDRAFFIAGSGVPSVQFLTPRFDRVFRDGFHTHFVRSLDEVVQVCDFVLSQPAEVLEARSREVVRAIHQRHMASNRVDTIISVYEALKKSRSGTMTTSDALRSLRLWHFLPEVNLQEELKFAVANWQG